MAEIKYPDPTAMGLFFVALLSFPIAFACFGFGGITTASLVGILKICAVFIAIAAIGAFIVGSNFGFTVFALVAGGVWFAAAYGGGLADNLVIGIIFLITLIWSIRAKTPKEMEIECFVHGAMCVSFSGRCPARMSYCSLIKLYVSSVGAIHEVYELVETLT